MPRLLVQNALSSQKCQQKVNNFVKKVESRRKVVEDARRLRMDRIHKDLKDIFQRETEYTKQVFEQLLPVKLVWDEERLEKWINMVPFHFESKAEPVHDPEVVDEDDEVLEETI